MSDLAARVEHALDSAGWTYETSADAPGGEHHWLLDRADGALDRPVLVVLHDSSSTIVCYSVSLDDVDIQYRGAVMEFLTLANYGLMEGNFEFDLSDGEVRFKTSLRVAGNEDLEVAVAHLLAFNLAVFAVYGEAFAAVAVGTADPAEALQIVEQR